MEGQAPAAGRGVSLLGRDELGEALLPATPDQDGAILPTAANFPVDKAISVASTGNTDDRRQRALLVCVLATALVTVVTTALLIFLPIERDRSPTPLPTQTPSAVPTLSFGPTFAPSPVPPVPNATSAFIVETLPLLNFSLAPIPGTLATHEVLIRLVNEATHTLKISVMYWNLLASETDDWPGDDDADIYGSQRGAALYGALEAAARRGVAIDVLQDNSTGGSLGNSEQLLVLQETYPEEVTIHWWNAAEWYGGGIMHMKLWVVDSRHTYIGSANMDWLSLAQVKELGVVVYNASHSVSRAADQLFTAWTAFAAEETITSSGVDHRLGAYLRVPCWEPALASTSRCVSPLPVPTYTNSWSTPAEWTCDQKVSGDTPADFFLSASPAALLGNCGSLPAWQGLDYGMVYDCSRTWDQDALVSTIRDANDFVWLSVMDFLPSNPYTTNTTCKGGVLWWPALIDALLTAATASGVQVRLLVSWWAHSDPSMLHYLMNLVSTATTSLSLAGDAYNGSLAVGVYTIPGWDSTEGPNATFPSYSRVNHAKYIVTDRRVNVGTSNMQWSYFFQTAGTSFNSNVPYLRAQTAAVFDRDWTSSYTTPLADFLLEAEEKATTAPAV